MTEQEKTQYWYTFNTFQRSREKKYAPKIKAALKQQIEDFIAAYQNGSPDPLNAVTLVPIIKVLKPLYKDAATTYGAKVIAGLPKLKARMPIEFSERMYQLVEQYFSVDFLNDAQGISETTKEYILKVLLEAEREGLGNDQIVAKLRSDEMTAARSRLIARTETTGAANFGAEAAAKSTGLLLDGEWISARDKRTRHDHVLADGQIVPAGGYFIVGGYKMKYPGDKGGKDGQLKVPAKEVVNCRCAKAFIPKRDAGGRLVRA